MHKQKIWQIKQTDLAIQTIITKELGVSPVLAQLLVNRGLGTVEQIKNFMKFDLSSLHNPYLLKDMQTAVTRIIGAVNKKEKILIYGDYDVDGITGTTVLVSALRKLTQYVDYYIPHRLQEGYGLHQEAVKKAAEQEYSLIITVDCGISGKEAVNWSVQNGKPDIIITDHHEPPSDLPTALAVINPKRIDCDYPFKELAGVGVALKLVQAVYASLDMNSSAWQEYLDLVCLGTIADVVPLLGENRVLVKLGLTHLTETSRKGLKALIKVCSLQESIITSGHVGFILAPRINAAGRLGDPYMAVELLLTEDEVLADQIAGILDEGNRERQNVEANVLKNAIQIVEQDSLFVKDKVLVLASEGWHPGVIGLVASRIVERYYKPTLVIALDGEQGKGSARSIPGFNLYRALQYCGENLLGYGGHTMAAGFSLKSINLEKFRLAINKYADEVLNEDHLTPIMKLDGIFSLNDITEQVIAEIEQLAPFGQANPGPLLCCPETKVINFKGVGKEGAHLKITLRNENGFIDGIGFNLAAYSEMLATAEKVNLAFVPEINEWQGKRRISLRVKDIKVGSTKTSMVFTDNDYSCDPSENYVLPESSPISCATETTCLPKNTYLMFQPEFILHELIEYNTDNKIFLPDINKHLLSIDRNVPISLNPDTIVTDRRNYPERINGLLGAELPKLTVILVGCGYQTVELSKYLQQSRPDLKNEAACYYMSMAEQDAHLVKNDLFNGKFRVLITTLQSAYDLKFTGLTNILIFHLPFTRMEWGLLCGLAKQNAGTQNVKLVFGQADWEINKERLLSIIPSREALAELFSYIRQASVSGKEETELNLTTAVKKLSAKGSGRVSNFMIQLGLNVFEEIGLLKYKRKGLSYNINLKPSPTNKLNLLESFTYNKWQNIWEETKNYSQFLLKSPVGELF